MTNIFENAYSALDESIMKGINKGVKAWNWTTGKTKADLANGLLTAAPMLECLGLLKVSPYSLIPGILASIPFLFITHITQKSNREMEKVEASALDKNALDFRLYAYEKTNSLIGPLWLVISGMQGSLGYFERNRNWEDNFFLASGHFLRSMSYYVMRTDYFPPRKSCVKRGLDKLDSILEEYRARPREVPIPTPEG